MVGLHSFRPSPDTRFAIEDRTRAAPAPHTPRENHLLAALPLKDYERVLPYLEPVPLPLGWILSCLDRLPSNELPMTHELSADMLGVGRESVTEADGELQQAGLIHFRRGHIAVLDHRQLEAQVCECYAVVKRACDRLLRPENTIGNVRARHVSPNTAQVVGDLTLPEVTSGYPFAEWSCREGHNDALD